MAWLLHAKVSVAKRDSWCDADDTANDTADGIAEDRFESSGGVAHHKRDW